MRPFSSRMPSPVLVSFSHPPLRLGGDSGSSSSELLQGGGVGVFRFLCSTGVAFDFLELWAD